MDRELRGYNPDEADAAFTGVKRFVDFEKFDGIHDFIDAAKADSRCGLSDG